MKKVYLDFETRSTVDLREVGLVNYITHPTTAILCMSYAVDGGLVQLWNPETDVFPKELFQSSDCRYVAHNYRFEQLTLKHLLGIEIPTHRWICTMALARSMCLPGSLKSLGAFLKFPKLEQRALHKLCKPRRTKSDEIAWWTPKDAPRDFEKLFEYCKVDTEISRKADQVFGEMDDRERKIWLVTRQINDRGFKIDEKLIAPAMAELAREKAALSEELAAITGGLTVDQTVKLARWCRLGSVDKASVRDTLKDDTLDPSVRRVLEIRKTLSQKSVAKLAKMIPLLTSDYRIVDGIPYAAAEKTKRWAGRGVQPQNFPRGSTGDVDPTIEKLQRGEPLDNPHDDISNALKRFIIGPFYAGDYSQIEARTLAWVAEENYLLDLFRSEADPYKDMAATIYNKPINKVTSDERFMGKQCLGKNTQVLTNTGWKRITEVSASDMLWDGQQWVWHQGCIFMGVKRTLNMMGVQITPDHLVLTGSGQGHWMHAIHVHTDPALQEQSLKLAHNTQFGVYPVGYRDDYRYSKCAVYDIANSGPRNRFTILTAKGPVIVHNCILSLGYGAGSTGFRNMLDKTYDVQISDSAAQNYVNVYRNKYPKIVQLWYSIERAVRYVISTRQPIASKLFRIEPAGKLGIAIVLPSGSKIYYHRTKLGSKGSINFYGRIAGQTWGMISTYGAKIVENICQSIARDIIAEALIRMRNWPIVSLVHDEVVSEIPEFGSLEKFTELMVEVPSWAEGLPIAVEAHEIDRYRK